MSSYSETELGNALQVRSWSWTALAITLAAASGCSSPQDAQTNEANESADDVADLVDFYVPRSMLYQAEQYSLEVVGSTDQWNGQYMDPEPQEMRSEASVLFTAYPRAILTPENTSVLQTLANPQLWDALSRMGVELMHPTAMLEAGGYAGREKLPSIDGGFDRMSLAIDDTLGNERDARQLVSVAAEHDAIVAGDVIPLHTGLGPDFRLATMNYREYPGIYDMIEVAPEHWDLLPAVDDTWGTAVILQDQSQRLLDLGYIPGTYDVLLADPESVDWSGWAATGEVPGVDGMSRRWVFGHLFKAQQPMLNWMDPTYAARRTQSGDVVRHVHDLGMRINRLDAVPFLGINPQPDGTAETFDTELAINGTEDLAFMHRKLGGWSWVELNVPIDQYLEYMEHGADFGYDFFTRAQTVHPLITGDARVLRIAHRLLVERGVDHGTLIHELQNHDEITYQLINLSSTEEVQLGDMTMSGEALAEQIREEMRMNVAGEAAPYNKLYRPAEDGVATTYAGFIAPAIGIADPYSATPEQVERIAGAHLLLAMATAMQPGIFGFSQWDIVGALPVPEELVADRTAEGDVRWVNRGGVDLLGRVPDATQTPAGLPDAQTLYGPLPQQLEDPDSFASRLMRIIEARERYGIADATMVAVPDVPDNGIVALVMNLPDGGVAVTALNYGREATEMTLDLSDIENLNELSGTPRDIVAGRDVGSLSGNTLTVPLDALSGRTIVIGEMVRDARSLSRQR